MPDTKGTNPDLGSISRSQSDILCVFRWWVVAPHSATVSSKVRRAVSLVSHPVQRSLHLTPRCSGAAAAQKPVRRMAGSCLTRQRGQLRLRVKWHAGLALLNTFPLTKLTAVRP